jgi:hypothetical protein
MISVGGIGSTPLIRIGKQSVIGKRPDGERMRRVKIQVFLESVNEKEIVPYPAA